MLNREYNFTPIHDVIDYWQHYWRHRVKEIKHAENFGSRIQTPRFILESIIYEIENNPKINPMLSKSFQSELCDWNKKPIFKTLFGKDCSLALNHWEKPMWVATLCKSILNKMDERLYYYAVIRALIEKLNNSTSLDVDNDRKDIHLYTDILIGEFIAKDYCLEDIEEMLHHPDVLMNEAFEIIAAENCVCGTRQDECSSKEEYYQILTDYFRNQSIKEKVHVLDLYYNKQSTDVIVLVRLTGIKGQIDIKFDNIHLYSVIKDKHKYILSSSKNSIESNVTEESFINAAIPVKCKGYHSAIHQAVKHLQLILSPIQIWLGIKTPISFLNKNITIVENGSERFVSFPTLPLDKSENLINNFPNKYDNYHYGDYHDITSARTKVISLSDRLRNIKNISIIDCDKLYNASKWIQNACNSTSNPDRLLYSWYAIESLAKLSYDYEQTISPKCNGILDLLQLILTPIVVRNRFFYYKNLVIDELYLNKDLYQNRYNVPDEINFKLDKPGGIKYIDFFHGLDYIKESVVNEAFVDKLCYLKDFYQESGLKEYGKSVNNEIIYIYCLRNHIVHDGNIIERQINYYSQRALHYASSLYNAILSVTTSNSLTIQDAIIKICADYETFKSESKSLLKQYNLS